MREDDGRKKGESFSDQNPGLVTGEANPPLVVRPPPGGFVPGDFVGGGEVGWRGEAAAMLADEAGVAAECDGVGRASTAGVATGAAADADAGITGGIAATAEGTGEEDAGDAADDGVARMTSTIAMMPMTASARNAPSRAAGSLRFFGASSVDGGTAVGSEMSAPMLVLMLGLLPWRSPWKTDISLSIAVSLKSTSLASTSSEVRAASAIMGALSSMSSDANQVATSSSLLTREPGGIA